MLCEDTLFTRPRIPQRQPRSASRQGELGAFPRPRLVEEQRDVARIGLPFCQRQGRLSSLVFEGEKLRLDVISGKPADLPRIDAVKDRPGPLGR